ncbi:MAG: hypothetical protein WC971_05780 [Coriobacteriia bacterium]
MDSGFLDAWHKLRMEHTHDRDGLNNYGCYNVEACRGCNFVYNSRACLHCHNCDSCIECIQCVDCKDCTHCAGLNGARYNILNREYTKEEYYKHLENLGIDPNVQVD